MMTYKRLAGDQFGTDSMRMVALQFFTEPNARKP
jgi:hypothetical protein